MSTLKATRGAQYGLIAEFAFNITDDMLNTSAVDTAFKAASGTVYDVIKLPVNAIVTGGQLIVTTASNDGGATATIAIGDSGTANRYLTATSIKSTGRTALVPTGYVGTGEDLRITLANTNGDATAGAVRVQVNYMIINRVNEAQTT